MDSTGSIATGTSTRSPPPHIGLLRDEILALRKLLGYWRDTETSSHGLPSQFGKTLASSAMSDVLFVAIDVDTKQGYEQILPDQDFHIGLSILDTRCLQDVLLGSPAAQAPEEIIQSYQFNIGDSKYCRRAAKKFLFGEAQSIQLVDFKSRYEGFASGRDAVLVFHGGSSSGLKVFQNLDLKPRPFYVLDTVKAAQHPLHLSYRYSLEKLLETLGISYAALHAAGNDAHFCLRALLMIAVTDARSQREGSSDAWVRALDSNCSSSSASPERRRRVGTSTGTPRG